MLSFGGRPIGPGNRFPFCGAIKNVRGFHPTPAPVNRGPDRENWQAIRPGLGCFGVNSQKRRRV
jgi:hypothetical protein